MFWGFVSPTGTTEQIMLVVASIFKGATINKKMRLDHELLSSPETDILRYHEYILYQNKAANDGLRHSLLVTCSSLTHMNEHIVWFFKE